ncbi:MAG: radical SAM protein [Clostridia bacterium]|nr:radical SAM protein [Clostridia bacterium]
MHIVEAKGILSNQNGMNVYRGCVHGCIYCDSRSECYGFKHDFEDIEVKINAPILLERALKSKRNKCMIGSGSMCDPYMPIEDEFKITRKCLELIDKYGYGATVLTKSTRVLRDIDILESINNKTKAVVQMTLTTSDDSLCKIIEPNVSLTSERFEALMKLKERGIPTVVWLSPILPFINDTEENIRAILDMCKTAEVKGIICFGMGVTLRDGDREFFYKALDKNFPGLKGEYIRRFGNNYEISSPDNRRLMRIFNNECRRHGILDTPDKCFNYLHEFPNKCEQLTLFDL